MSRSLRGVSLVWASLLMASAALAYNGAMPDLDAPMPRRIYTSQVDMTVHEFLFPIQHRTSLEDFKQVNAVAGSGDFDGDALADGSAVGDDLPIRVSDNHGRRGRGFL